MSEELAEFLRRPGTIDILCSIPERGIRFGELLDKVRISRGTLNKRLKQGLARNTKTDFPGLWDRYTTKQRDANTVYMLSPSGRKLAGAVTRHGMPELLLEIIVKTQEFERQKTALIDAVETHGLDNLDETYTNNDD